MIAHGHNSTSKPECVLIRILNDESVCRMSLACVSPTTTASDVLKSIDAEERFLLGPHGLYFRPSALVYVSACNQGRHDCNWYWQASKWGPSPYSKKKTYDKTITVVVGPDEVYDVELSPGTTALHILTELNVWDQWLIALDDGYVLNAGQDLYGFWKVKDRDTLVAVPAEMVPLKRPDHFSEMRKQTEKKLSVFVKRNRSIQEA